MRLFVNVYHPRFRNCLYETRREADLGASGDRKECVEIEYPGLPTEADTELSDAAPETMRYKYPLPNPTLHEHLPGGPNLVKHAVPDSEMAADVHPLELQAQIKQIEANLAPLAALTPPASIKYTLPTDSNARKDVPLLAGFLNYIPAAAVKFAIHSKMGNDKHNKGQPIHHARWKSTDQEECIMRHLLDIQDLHAHLARGTAPREDVIKALISEATAEFWRAGIFLQELCEKYEGAPRAPGARLEGETP